MLVSLDAGWKLEGWMLAGLGADRKLQSPPTWVAVSSTWALKTLPVVPKAASSLLEAILLSLRRHKRFTSYRSSEKSTGSIMTSSLCHDKKSRTQMQIMELMQVNVVITKMRFKAYGVIRQVVG